MILNFILVTDRIKFEIKKNCEFILDKRYETLILPINGTATPFHISTIKVKLKISIHLN